MLPENLHRRAILRARKRGVSLGELIRDSLGAAMPNPTYDAGSDPLYEDAVFDGPAPADTAKEPRQVPLRRREVIFLDTGAFLAR